MLNAKGGVNSHSLPADYMEAVGVILHRYDQVFHETCVSSAIANLRPRCKCVHFYLYNLKPETFSLSRSLLSAEEGADQIQFEER